MSRQTFVYKEICFIEVRSFPAPTVGMDIGQNQVHRIFNMQMHHIMKEMI